ncbi:MAG: hypothetical protein AAGB26_03305 [Planctomycetota bacterium]
MLKTIKFVCGTCLLFACAVSVPCFAQDAEASAAAAEAKAAEKAAKDAYREEFGVAERDVRRTRVTNDDAEFAQRLVQEANSAEHDETLTLYLYDRAYFYGLRDARGYQAASDALDKMLEKDETRKFEIGEMRLVLWEKWHEAEPDSRVLKDDGFIDLCISLASEAEAAGDTDLALKFLNRGNRFGSKNKSARLDDVRDSIKDLIRKRKLEEEIAGLEEALAAGKEPRAADQLAMLYLTELDKPDKAKEYAEKMNDKALAGKVTLSAKVFNEATTAEANENGMFYYSVFSDNKGDDVAMLIRSRVWLTEYLSREPGEDQAALVKTADETLGEIDSALLKLGIGKKLRRKMSSLVRGEGQFDRPPHIQAAIDKGVEWLYSVRNDQRHWEQDQPNHRNYGGYTALVVYALLMADEEPKLNGDLSRSVYFMMNADMTGTYGRCFRIHAWEVMPHRERYRQTLMQDVAWLRQAGTRHGFWGYTKSGNDVRPGERADLSTTLAGGLGLWIGEAVGGISAKKVYWERTARALIDVQLEDGGWSYNPYTNMTSTGSMTAAGLTLLYASYPHLGEVAQKQADETIARGMEWMDKNFSETTNVNKGGRHQYYYAAVQHVGLFSGRKEFRAKDWYDSIAEHLVKTQTQAGSWGTGASDTAFAIAFLCRGGIVYEQTDGGVTGTEQDSASVADASTEAEAPGEDAAAEALPENLFGEQPE